MRFLGAVFLVLFYVYAGDAKESSCVAKSALYNIICSRFEYWCKTQKSVRTFEIVCRYTSFVNSFNMNVSSTDQVEDIELYYSDMPEIKPGMFEAYPLLKRLYIQNGNTEILRTGAFKSSSKLDWLILKFNKISNIEPNTFDGLKALAVLNLNGNKIRSLTSQMFAGLVTIKYLNLKQNQISVIEPDTFKYIKEVGVLFLNDNQLTTLAPNLFANNGELRVLWMQNNSLPMIPDGLLKNKPLLQEVLLDNNKIVHFDTTTLNGTLSLQDNFIVMLNSIGNVVSFNASYNLLNKLGAGFFNKSTQIEIILLNHNSLSSIEPNLFRGLKKLETLQLEENSLRRIEIGTFQDLASLKTLNLSNNRLEEVETGLFTGLGALQKLDLSYNKLKVIETSTMYSLKSLQMLLLKGNLMEILDARNLIEHLRELKHISLDENRWNCSLLPEILRNFEKGLVQVSSGSSYQTHNVHGISCVARTIVVNNFYAGDVGTTEDIVTEVVTIDTNNFPAYAYPVKAVPEESKTETTSNVYLVIITIVLVALLVIAIVSIVKKYLCSETIKFRNMYNRKESTCKLELDE